MDNDTARSEIESIVDGVLERSTNFSVMYTLFLGLAFLSGMVFAVTDSSQVLGMDKEWFVVFFEVSIFVLGLTILFGSLWALRNVDTLRIIFYNYTRRGPETTAFAAVLLTTAFLMFLNFLIGPSFGSLGLVLITLGLILEVSLVEEYKHLYHELYDEDKEKVVDHMMKDLHFAEESDD